MPRTVGACRSCGNERALVSRGRCQSCAQKEKVGLCPGCGRERRLASKGLCWTCYKNSRTGSCADCGRDRPLQARGLCGSCLRRQRTGECSGCGAEARLWPGSRCWACYHYDPEVLAKHRGSVRRSNLKRDYGLTPEQYDELLEAQGGACALSGCPATAEDQGQLLSVDHDHACCPGWRSCGACVRGLLCWSCNALLGHAHDDPELLRGAIAYLSG